MHKLRAAIMLKRQGRMRRGLCMLHGNAPAHISNIALAGISAGGFDVINHLSYSPDIASSDYYLFSDLKKILGRKAY